MTRELMFWILMLLWLVLGGFSHAKDAGRNWSGIGAALLPWVLIVLLGWQVFGPIVQK